MKHLFIVACCLCLLALSAPARSSGDGDLREAPPDASPQEPAAAPSVVAFEIPPPVAVASQCQNPYATSGQQPDKQQKCVRYCVDTGGTFESFVDLGRGFYYCGCCAD